MLRSLALASAAALFLSQPSHATDAFTISPDQLEVCVGDDLELQLCTRPGDYGLLLLSLVPGQTTIPGFGTFQVPLDPFPTILDLGIFPAGGCRTILDQVPCTRPDQTFYVQGLSVQPMSLSILVSNPASIRFKKICQDWDGNLVNDACDPDCDGDGVIDALELDSDGDGKPNDCDTSCKAPKKACDDGCWKLQNKSSWYKDGGYGLRMDGLFGDWNSPYTFSFEHPGTDVQMCHDSDADTIELKGVVYGGRGFGPDWDPDLQGYARIEFTWTGAKCKDGKLKVKEWGGDGYGSFTWLETGEVIPLDAKAEDDVYAIFDWDEELRAQFKYPGMPWKGCQGFDAEAIPASNCP